MPDRTRITEFFPAPPYFSLPSTFKGTGSRDRIQLYGQKGIVSGMNKSLLNILEKKHFLERYLINFFATLDGSLSVDS
jgi:hypothetical protein